MLSIAHRAHFKNRVDRALHSVCFRSSLYMRISVLMYSEDIEHTRGAGA